MVRLRQFIVMLCCFGVGFTHADLPLTVADILVDKNRFRVGYR